MEADRNRSFQPASGQPRRFSQPNQASTVGPDLMSILSGESDDVQEGRSFLGGPPVHGGLEFHRDEGLGMGGKKVDGRRGIGDVFDSGQGTLNRLLPCPVPGGSAQKRSNHRSRNCPCRMRQVEDRLRGNNARPVPALDRQGIAPPSLVDPLALDGRRRHGA